MKWDEGKAREVIARVFEEELGIKNFVPAEWVWSNYTHQWSLKGEENLYQEFKKAVQLMKKFYRNRYGEYNLFSFTPHGYTVAKEAEELELDKISLEYLSVDVDTLKALVDMANHYPLELIDLVVNGREGERYCGVFIFRDWGSNDYPYVGTFVGSGAKVLEKVLKRKGLSPEFEDKICTYFSNNLYKFKEIGLWHVYDDRLGMGAFYSLPDEWQEKEKALKELIKEAIEELKNEIEEEQGISPTR